MLALKLWGESVPIPGTVAENYLRERWGLKPPFPANLAVCGRDLIAAVHNSHGYTCGLQYIWLSPLGSSIVRFWGTTLLGNYGDGAVKFGAPDSFLGLASCPEAALKVYRRFSIACWGIGPGQDISAIKFPDSVTHIIVFEGVGNEPANPRPVEEFTAAASAVCSV